MINFWVSFEDYQYTFAEWNIKFPAIHTSQIESYIELTEKIIKYCHQHQLLFSERYLKELLVAPSKICYYDKAGKIQEGWTDNVGHILRETNVLGVGEGYREDCRPVYLKSRFSGNGYVLSIQVRTNIWFPLIPRSIYLNDFLRKYVWTEKSPIPFAHESQFVDDLNNKVIDGVGINNEELAFLNTIRFNRWLSQIRVACEKLGGVMKLETPYGTGKDYRLYLSDQGITF